MSMFRLAACVVLSLSKLALGFLIQFAYVQEEEALQYQNVSFHAVM